MTWLDFATRKRREVADAAPGALSLQQTIGRLATRANAAEARLGQILRLHTADVFGAWCCHCAKAWPCPTAAVASGLDCASHDPISGAVCQKPEGHMGAHGGMTKEGSWRNW